MCWGFSEVEKKTFSKLKIERVIEIEKKREEVWLLET